LLTAKRVDLVLQGHDHDYQRSKQLMCGRVGAFDAACVADTGADGLYTKGAGPVFVIAGTTGGGGLTSINATDPEQPYFARSMGGSSPSPGRGIVRYSVGPTSLTGEFVGSTTTFTDSFTIRSGP
jgi:hypothetical protein